MAVVTPMPKDAMQPKTAKPWPLPPTDDRMASVMPARNFCHGVHTRKATVHWTTWKEHTGTHTRSVGTHKHKHKHQT